MDIFKHVTFDEYNFFINRAGGYLLEPYAGEFELVGDCQVFCIPKGKELGTKVYF